MRWEKRHKITEMSEKRKKRTSERVMTQSASKEKIKLLNNEGFTQNKQKKAKRFETRTQRPVRCRWTRKIPCREAWREGEGLPRQTERETWTVGSPRTQPGDVTQTQTASCLCLQSSARDKCPRYYCPVWPCRGLSSSFGRRSDF